MEMARLDKMISDLCPHGIEYIHLSDIVTIVRGIRVVRSQLTTDAPYPVYQNSLTPLGYYSKSNCSANTVFIIMAGAAGEIGYSEKPFWAADDCYYLLPNSKLLSRFLYHFLLNSRTFILSHVRKASVPRLSRKVIETLTIPVPPLEVQQEIVRILDHFTELTTELTAELAAELAAREKQHQYYTQHLYDSIKEKGVPVVCVKDVCDLLTGFPFDSSHFVSEGIHLLRGMNIKRGFLDYSDGNNRYWNTVKGYEKFLLADDDIVIAMDGSLVGKSYGQVKKQHLPVLLVQRVTRVRATKINAHYLYHYISSGAFTKYVEQKKTGGAVPHISMKDIENFTLPIPPEKLQEEISEVLDRFDALCNDLTSGLPAEIAARQKQYEYYRDKLLTFKKKASDSFRGE